MAQRSFPFDAGAGATISETDWQKMARRFRQTGVIGGYLSQLAASADGSALSVSVATGGAFVEGFYYENDAPLAVPLAAANATNPRIDTIIVRLDRTANTAVLDKVTGTPAASPVAATLSQTDSLYELPLANVLVPAAAGVIVAGNVTDRRSITQTFDSAAYVAKAEYDAAWTAYTPTLSNATLGNGSVTGRFKRVGKTVHYRAKFTIGSTTTFAGGGAQVFIGSPTTHGPMESFALVTAFHSVQGLADGYAFLNAGGTGAGINLPFSLTDSRHGQFAGGTTWLGAVPGAGSTIDITGTYESA